MQRAEDPTRYLKHMGMGKKGGDGRAVATDKLGKALLRTFGEGGGGAAVTQCPQSKKKNDNHFAYVYFITRGRNINVAAIPLYHDKTTCKT